MLTSITVGKDIDEIDSTNLHGTLDTDKEEVVLPCCAIHHSSFLAFICYTKVFLILGVRSKSSDSPYKRHSSPISQSNLSNVAGKKMTMLKIVEDSKGKKVLKEDFYF
uniref:Ovule protein n=1 Tax=Heterorhabditis bacteriophora TaxID=37862 RepID=A0A1I7XB38_HETBA